MSFTPQQRRYVGQHRDPAMILLLSIVTCGIYYLVWLSQTSQELQDYLGETDTSSGMEVLLVLITCGMYVFYWDYKTAKKIARMQEMAGIAPTDNSVIYLLLDFFQLGFVCALIEQYHLNEIWRRPS